MFKKPNQKVLEEIKDKVNKQLDNKEILAKAQKVAEEQYQKDCQEYSNLVNNWLRSKGYILDYQVLIGRTINGVDYNVLPRLLKRTQ